MGDAYYAKPKFTSFNDTYLADVFERLSVETATPYHLALAIGIPVLFSVFLSVQFFSFATSRFRISLPCFFRSQSAKNVRNGQLAREKRNTRFFQTSHLFLIASTLALIITLACLLELSSLPDNDASRKRPVSLFPNTFVTN